MGRTPVALSYQLVTSVPWRIGDRSVDVLRLRRLDTLNVELAMYGATDEGLPVVLLDRIESTLADELPLMYGHEVEGTGAPERARSRGAGARARVPRGARLGAGLAAAVGDLVQRNKLFAEMRSSFARVRHPVESARRVRAGRALAVARWNASPSSDTAAAR